MLYIWFYYYISKILIFLSPNNTYTVNVICIFGNKILHKISKKKKNVSLFTDKALWLFDSLVSYSLYKRFDIANNSRINNIWASISYHL